MSSTVGQKGQIVIEKSIREALGVAPGYIAIQRLMKDHVVIFFFPPEHNRSLRGILASKIRKRPTTDDWSEIKEAAWAQATTESWKEENLTS